jgi:hypothetical protein
MVGILLLVSCEKGAIKSVNLDSGLDRYRRPDCHSMATEMDVYFPNAYAPNMLGQTSITHTMYKGCLMAEHEAC